MQLRESWLLFALGSALFAAPIVLFGKFGVVGINSNLATFIRIITGGRKQAWQERLQPRCFCSEAQQQEHRG